MPAEPDAKPTDPPAVAKPVPSWFSEFKAGIDALNEESGLDVATDYNHESNRAELTIPFTVDSLEDFEDATHQAIAVSRRIRRNRAADDGGGDWENHPSMCQGALA